MLQFAILTIFPMAMLVSALMDIMTMTIPNRVNLALVAGFFLLVPFVGMGWQELGIHLAMGAAMLVLGMGLFAMGWIGGGDAKLFAATGLWLGYGPHMVEYALLASVFGGALTVFILVLRSFDVLPSFLTFKWLLRLHDEHQGAPYGVALAAAALMIYPHTIWMQAIM